MSRIILTREPVYITAVTVIGLVPVYRIYTGPDQVLSHWLSLDTLNIWMPFGIQYELIDDQGELHIEFKKTNIIPEPVTSPTMTLITPQEVAEREHIAWLSKSETAKLKFGKLTVLPYVYLSQAVIQILTQDREATLTALLTALEGKIKDPITLNDVAYNVGIDQAITIVKELLTPTNK